MQRIDFGTVRLPGVIAMLLWGMAASPMEDLTGSVQLTGRWPIIESSHAGAPLLIKGRPENQSVEIRVEGYQFEVPRDWKVGTDSEKESIRPSLQADPRAPVKVLAMFENLRKSCLVVIYETHFDDGFPNNYLDNLREQNFDRFRMGMSQGIVKQVFENQRNVLGGKETLLLDWEGIRGGMRRMRQWVLQISTRPKETVTVSGFCNDLGYSDTKGAIDKVAVSITAMEQRP